MMKRVLLVHNFYQFPGGEDVVFAAEKKLLRSKGHEVFEYTDNNQRLDQLPAIQAALQTVWSNPSRNKLRDILTETRPDIVHFHNTFLMISPAVYSVCREQGIPVVQTLHNYRLFCPSAVFFRDGRACEDCMHKLVAYPGILHACYRHSRRQTTVVAGMLLFHRIRKTWHKEIDRFIALSEFARAKFIEGGLPAEKLVVKPNFIDPDPGLREGTGEYALFVGRLSAEKGVELLLEAWRQIPQVPLKIVGEGPQYESMRSYIQSNGLDKVELLGKLPHERVFSLMKQARFLIFSSECYENIPTSILEAFACGLPVVAPSFGAAGEIVKPDINGLHFEVGNPGDLAKKANWAWQNPSGLKDLGLAARRDYLQNYTPEANYKKLIDIYEKVIAAKGNGAEV